MSTKSGLVSFLMQIVEDYVILTLTSRPTSGDDADWQLAGQPHLWQRLQLFGDRSNPKFSAMSRYDG
jgi:hypothetical protein